ncbi:hypothetical protein CASFOL_034894 [Castilleja foliolosa]|uniref:Pectinesterase inhibitor domain-containing protein n=1 Tax=Castilleja foliolosa TaxID=1961234 RepID=A0ABD3BTE4_9LAMI
MASNLLFVLISLTVLLRASNAADVSTALCDRTSNKGLCLSIVGSDRRGNLKTSPNGVAAILRDSALSTVASTQFKISTLLRTATAGGRAFTSLRACSAQYVIPASTLRVANFGTINRAVYTTLLEDINEAKEGPVNCESSFQQAPAIPSPLTAENQKLRDILVIIENVINIVVCNHPSAC